MKLLLMITAGLILTAPLYAQSKDFNNEIRSLKTSGVKSSTALQQIEESFGVEIKIYGYLPQRAISTDLDNVTLKSAVKTVLKESDVTNYIFSIDNSRNKMIVNVLKRPDDKITFAQNHKQDLHYGKSINKNEMTNFDGVLEIDKKENDLNKPFTFEELEALKDHSLNLTANESESNQNFSQEYLEKLQRENELNRKLNDQESGEIISAHLAQINNTEIVAEEEISKEQLNLLRE